jgi:peroxiredoxin family protein
MVTTSVAGSRKRLSIIATRGTLDWAYPPFILASTAAALGYEVGAYFTFYGLELLKKKLALRVSPLGNPAMPMPLAMNKWFPVIFQSLPGMEGLMSAMMKSKLKTKGVASIDELRGLCLDAGVKLVACQMTVDLFDYDRSDFIDGIEWGGAATFFEYAGTADMTLFT